jgi:hypothetical protein
VTYGRLVDEFNRMGEKVRWSYVRRMTAWLVPSVFAALTIVVVVKYLRTPEWTGIDARLYAAAARAMLEGRDPWAVSDSGVYFAAPPPTLLAFVPFAFLAPGVTTIIWIGGSAILGLLAVRALRLPLWWLFFPPIVDGVIAGNPDVAVLALLVVANGRWSAIAPFLKIYAIVPLLGERRWATLAVSLGALALTAPLLPWATWFRQFGAIADHLTQTSATTSVWGQPVLMVVAAVALLALGIRRAGWLAVPVLWPSTQFHYAAIAVPGLSPFLAIAWCYPSPVVWVAAVVAAAAHRWFVERPSAHRLLAEAEASRGSDPPVPPARAWAAVPVAAER